MKSEKPENNEIVESSAENLSAEHVSVEYSSVEHLSAEHVSAEYPGVEHLSAEHVNAEYSSVEHLSAEHVSAGYPGVGHLSAEHVSVEYSSVEHLSAEHVSAGYSSAAEYLSAETVVIEFTDQASGVTYRRELPLHIEESANGIVLSGENLSGEESSIVFLSQSALERIRELSGEGAEKPRCDNHN